MILKKELINYSQSLDLMKKLFSIKLSKDSVGAGRTRTRF